MCSNGRLKFPVPVIYGVTFMVGPWHVIPLPYWLVIYGPCKTCMAWLVTEPELFAIGFAVALTPPTSAAYAGVETTVDASIKHSRLAIV